MAAPNRRLMTEIARWENAPGEYSAAPLQDNIYEWHFTIQGAEGTAFEGGLYHGIVRLPQDYPQRGPEAIIFLTENGRFEVGKKICTSTSSYHPELWSSSWTLSVLFRALRIFMIESSEGTLHSLDIPHEERVKLARESHSFSCTMCGYNAAIFGNEPAAAKTTEEYPTELPQPTLLGSGDSKSISSEYLSSAIAGVSLPTAWMTCYLCLGEIEANSEVVQLGCPEDGISGNRSLKHRFHFGCLFLWIRSSQSFDIRSSCPVCRKQFSAELLKSMHADYEKTDMLRITLLIEMVNSPIFIEQKAGSFRLVSAASNPNDCKTIAEKGGIVALSRLLDSNDPETVQHSITALKNLTLYKPNISQIFDLCHEYFVRVISSNVGHTRLMGLILINIILSEEKSDWVQDNLLFSIQECAGDESNPRAQKEAELIMKRLLDLINSSVRADLDEILGSLDSEHPTSDHPRLLCCLKDILKKSAILRKHVYELGAMNHLGPIIKYHLHDSISPAVECVLELLRYRGNRRGFIDAGFLEHAVQSIGNLEFEQKDMTYTIITRCLEKNTEIASITEEKKVEYYIAILQEVSQTDPNHTELLKNGVRILTMLALDNSMLEDEYLSVCYDTLEFLAAKGSIPPKPENISFSQKECFLLKEMNFIAHKNNEISMNVMFNPNWMRLWESVLDHHDNDVVSEALDAINSLIYHESNYFGLLSSESMLPKILSFCTNECHPRCLSMAVWIIRNVTCKREGAIKLRRMDVLAIVNRLGGDVSPEINKFLFDLKANLDSFDG